MGEGVALRVEVIMKIKAGTQLNENVGLHLSVSKLIKLNQGTLHGTQDIINCN